MYLFSPLSFKKHNKSPDSIDINTKFIFQMNYIALDCVQYSFGTDSLISSRPIYQEVWTPSEINSIFDVITYFKVSFGCL